MTIYTPVDRATDLDGLSLMLAQFAVSTYELHLIAMLEGVAGRTTADTLVVASKGAHLSLTGSSPFGMDDTMTYVAARICTALVRGATIEVGDAGLRIDDDHPIEEAYRPTEDVLILRTGGRTPAVMTIVADRSRGPAN